VTEAVDRPAPAAVTLLLASDESSSVTGIDVVVDGGIKVCTRA
jgi:hypothetical protein